jgi:hypothetical protein
MTAHRTAARRKLKRIAAKLVAEGRIVKVAADDLIERLLRSDQPPEKVVEDLIATHPHWQPPPPGWES